MLSIICAYNNRSILKKSLERSLLEQKEIEYEYLPINAKEYGFVSASETLNYAGKEAAGEYILFVHQDVIFEDPLTLKKIEEWCNNHKFGIAGVAGGINQNGKVIVFSNIHHGERHEKVCKQTLDTAKCVDTLDECLLIIPQKIFKRYKFSDLGKTWHLYGTDYSLKMKSYGYSSWVIPIDIWHLSKGASLNSNYYSTIYQLCHLYKESGKIITTIYGIWPTNKYLLFIKCLFRKIRFAIRGI